MVSQTLGQAIGSTPGKQSLVELNQLSKRPGAVERKPHPVSFVNTEARFIVNWVKDKPEVESVRLQVVSLSSFQPAHPVTSAGHMGPKGYTVGQPTFAGSMAFSSVGQRPLAFLFDYYNALRGAKVQLYDFTTLQSLPPVDCLLVTHDLHSEDMSVCYIKDLKFVDSGFSISVDALGAPQTVSFIASGYSNFNMLGLR